MSESWEGRTGESAGRRGLAGASESEGWEEVTGVGEREA